VRENSGLQVTSPRSAERKNRKNTQGPRAEPADTRPAAPENAMPRMIQAVPPHVAGPELTALGRGTFLQRTAM